MKILSRAVDVVTEVSVKNSIRPSFYRQGPDFINEKQRKAWPLSSFACIVSKDELSGNMQMSGDEFPKTIQTVVFFPQSLLSSQSLKTADSFPIKSGESAEFGTADFSP